MRFVDDPSLFLLGTCLSERLRCKTDNQIDTLNYEQKHHMSDELHTGSRSGRSFEWSGNTFALKGGMTQRGNFCEWLEEWCFVDRQMSE